MQDVAVWIIVLVSRTGISRYQRLRVEEVAAGRRNSNLLQFGSSVHSGCTRHAKLSA
jgi:hypothetical protein